MKIIVNREEFSQAASRVASIVRTNSPKPILKYVRIEAKGDCTLEATDLEVSIRATVAAHVETGGACLIDAAKLTAIVGSQAADDISIEVTDKAICLVSDGSYRMPVANVSEYPTLPAPEQGRVSVGCESLATAIRRTMYCCDGGTRYATEGILFERTGGTLFVVATDGRRLSKVEVPSSGDADWFAIIPEKGCKALLRSLSGVPGECGIAVSNSSASFSFAGTDIESRLIEGRFPKWQDALPTSHAHQVSLVSGPLAAAVKRASLMTSEESMGVSFDFSDGTLRMTGRSKESGESVSEIPIDSAGSFSTELVPRYVLDILGVLDREELVSVSLPKREGGVVVFRDSGNYECAVMPIARIA